MSKESAWQEKITGEWYGCPSVFDADGTHLGFNKVNRSSVFKDGLTTYFMHTDLNVEGPLRARFEARGFAFGVRDDGADRVYMGPDFFGAGKPYGNLVDAHYYSPGWSSDLKTMVHILPDGQTQAYSSLLYEGPRIIAVFNGLYLMATDYETNPDTKARIDTFIAAERLRGNTPHILPMKEAGEWSGVLSAYSPEQKAIGETYAKIEYRPLDLRRAELVLSLEGVVNLKARYLRSREGFRHDFHGPELYGNAMAYGRALYSSLHFTGGAQKLVGRDFLIDDNFGLSVAWQLSKSDHPQELLHGVLRWTPREEVLIAQY